jgi:hypothetical protein
MCTPFVVHLLPYISWRSSAEVPMAIWLCGDSISDTGRAFNLRAYLKASFVCRTRWAVLS